MERTIRGQLEKELDGITEPQFLATYIEVFKTLFPIKSMEDCLFGFVVAIMFTRFLDLLKKPTLEQRNEFVEMLERRTMQIKGSIKLVLSR